MAGRAWSVTVSAAALAALADGPQTVTANVSDQAGTAAPEASTTFEVDTTADAGGDLTLDLPDVEIDPTEVTNVQATVSGLDSDATGVITFFDGTNTVQLNVSGNGTENADLTGLANGQIATTLDVTDDAGNTAQALGSDLSLDTTAPGIAFDSPIAGDDILNAAETAANLVVTGTTSNVEDGQQVTVRLNGQSYVGTATGNAWTVTIPSGDLQALTDAAYTLTADVADAAGNTATVFAGPDITIDTTPPGAPTIDSLARDTAPVGDNSTADRTPTFFGTAERDSTVEIFDGATSLGTAIVYGSGNWSFTTQVLTPGTHSFTASATDVAGNQGQASSAFALNIEDTPKSFEGAVGFGAFASGGRGGQVIKVTNSNDSGAGSLRWALEDVDGPRIVVFEGVNNISLEDEIVITQGDLTIAGQTAGGVQVTGDSIIIRADNVIMRGMMIRDNFDGLKIVDAENIMIDHNSFEWSVDENVSMFITNKAPTDITFSNNIIAEGLDNAGHPKGSHSMGMLVYEGNDEHGVVENITLYGNLFAFNDNRNPWFQNGDKVELINNYVYGAGEQDAAFHIGEGAGCLCRPTYFNIINNFLQAGPETNDTDASHFWIATPSPAQYYLSGNIEADVNGILLNLEPHGGGVEAIQSSPVFAGSGIDPLSADSAKDYVLSNAGANPNDRDEADQRIIDLVEQGTGGLVDDPQYGTLITPTIHEDSDSDGIPNWFEDAYGLDKNSNDANDDSDGDGFTNIEEYINGLIDGFDL